MRGLPILLLSCGCDLALGIDQVGSANSCAPGMPFGTGTRIDVDLSFSVEAARFDPGQSTAYLAMIKADNNGIFDVANTDLYSAPFNRETHQIGGVSRLGGVSSAQYDSYPTLTADGNHIVFASRRNSALRLRLYVATAQSGSFDTPQIDELALTGSDVSANEPQALGTSDVLYFQAQQEIFRAQGSPPAYAPAVPVGGLSSPMGDNAPVVTDDDLEIFFASNRDAPVNTLPYLDIYTATRATPTEDFAPPMKVPALSTDDTDYPLWISPDACDLYYINKIGSTATLSWTTRR